MNKTTEHYYLQALAALQFLEEIHGPAPRDYVSVMRHLSSECEHRAQVCEDTHLAAVPAYRAHGFTIHNDAGGARQFRRDVPSAGVYILVTAQGDCDLPRYAHDAVTAGLYTFNGSWIGTIEASNLDDVREQIAAGLWGKT